MKIRFLVIALVGKPVNADHSGEMFIFDFETYIFSYLFVSLLIKKELRKIIHFFSSFNKLVSFFYIPMFPMFVKFHFLFTLQP